MTTPQETTAAADRILDRYRIFAMVGASPRVGRSSHGVMGVLLRHGYSVIPVNPRSTTVRRLTSYPDLASIPGTVEVVDIFRRSEVAGVHVDEAIAIGAKAVWMQLGVIDEAAAQRARDAGLEVVMDRCPAIEFGRRKDEQASATRTAKNPSKTDESPQKSHFAQAFSHVGVIHAAGDRPS